MASSIVRVVSCNNEARDCSTEQTSKNQIKNILLNCQWIVIFLSAFPAASKTVGDGIGTSSE
ncbi:MAG TPA: hypothetical protein PJ981_01470 [Accumulibacter sp.]|nr:hypothetical protein [Accumulibacter sp.]